MINPDNVRLLPAADGFWPTPGMVLADLLIDKRPLLADARSVAAVPLLRGDEPDGAMAMLMDVPAHE